MQRSYNVQFTMIKFRFSIILLFMVLPPILYVGTLYFVEKYAGIYVQAELEKVYLGDVTQLLNGSRHIKEVIQTNVYRYARNNLWTKMGCHIIVTIKTRKNTLLYPLYDYEVQTLSLADMQPIDIATENYRLMNEIPEVSSVLNVPLNSFFAFSVLGGCILLSLGGISTYYWRWQRTNRIFEENQANERLRLKELSDQYRGQMAHLEEERALIASELENMQTRLSHERDKASVNEEEMLDEIIALEGKMANNLALQEKQRQEIVQLQEQIEQIVKEQKSERQGSRAKPFNLEKKRLNTIYKNIKINDRAVEGYVSLAEDLKIKCEEVIYEINNNPANIKIKRKVFGKKNRVTVLEVVFGYKGRLYCRFQPNRKVELLIIGTKNTQQTDMLYLDRL